MKYRTTSYGQSIMTMIRMLGDSPDFRDMLPEDPKKRGNEKRPQIFSPDGEEFLSAIRGADKRGKYLTYRITSANTLEHCANVMFHNIFARMFEPLCWPVWLLDLGVNRLGARATRRVAASIGLASISVSIPRITHSRLAIKWWKAHGMDLKIHEIFSDDCPYDDMYPLVPIPKKTVKTPPDDEAYVRLINGENLVSLKKSIPELHVIQTNGEIVIKGLRQTIRGSWITLQRHYDNALNFANAVIAPAEDAENDLFTKDEAEEEITPIIADFVANKLGKLKERFAFISTPHGDWLRQQLQSVPHVALITSRKKNKIGLWDRDIEKMERSEFMEIIERYSNDYLRIWFIGDSKRLPPPFQDTFFHDLFFKPSLPNAFLDNEHWPYLMYQEAINSVREIYNPLAIAVMQKDYVVAPTKTSYSANPGGNAIFVPSNAHIVNTIFDISIFSPTYKLDRLFTRGNMAKIQLRGPLNQWTPVYLHELAMRFRYVPNIDEFILIENEEDKKRKPHKSRPSLLCVLLSFLLSEKVHPLKQ
jgi:hypothetical protein